MDITIPQFHPFIQLRERGLRLRPACVALYIECTTIRAKAANKR